MPNVWGCMNINGLAEGAQPKSSSSVRIIRHLDMCSNMKSLMVYSILWPLY